MNTDAKPQQKKEDGSVPAPRRIYTVPLPENISRCQGCPYPAVGFICWSRDETCLRTKMDRLHKTGR